MFPRNTAATVTLNTTAAVTTNYRCPVTHNTAAALTTNIIPMLILPVILLPLNIIPLHSFDFQGENRVWRRIYRETHGINSSNVDTHTHTHTHTHTNRPWGQPAHRDVYRNLV